MRNILHYLAFPALLNLTISTGNMSELKISYQWFTPRSFGRVGTAGFMGHRSIASDLGDCLATCLAFLALLYLTISTGNMRELKISCQRFTPRSFGRVGSDLGDCLAP